MIRNRVSAVLVAMLLGCSAPTEVRPIHTDVDRARAAWLANRPSAYSFELSMTGSWYPRSGYYRVEVSNGQITSTTASAWTTPTIDEIWDQILAARAKGELNSASFDERGVPVESDMGPWPVDGGVSYSVRNFAERR